MAIDKQIIELPDITLQILQSGVDVSFVAQVQGYALDFQVPLDVMSAYLNSSYQIGVFGGENNPSTPVGNKGDLYFQTNGKIYQKLSTGWTLKATIPVYTPPSPYIDFITTTPAVTIPKQVGIPGRFTNMEIGVKFELTLPQNGAFYPATTNGATMWYVAQYSDAARTNVSRIDIYAGDDGTGHFPDAFKFTIYAL